MCSIRDFAPLSLVLVRLALGKSPIGARNFDEVKLPAKVRM